MTTERFEVQRTSLRTRRQIFRLLATPRTRPHRQLRHADGASGDPVAAVRRQFRSVHHGPRGTERLPMAATTSPSASPEFVPDRRDRLTISGQIRPPIGHIYGYRLEPVDAATLVNVVLRLVGHRPRSGGSGASSRSCRGRAAGTLGILGPHSHPQGLNALLSAPPHAEWVRDADPSHDRKRRGVPLGAALSQSPGPPRTAATSRCPAEPEPPVQRAGDKIWLPAVHQPERRGRGDERSGRRSRVPAHPGEASTSGAGPRWQGAVPGVPGAGYRAWYLSGDGSRRPDLATARADARPAHAGADADLSASRPR